jgi:hypothetical protein
MLVPRGPPLVVPSLGQLYRGSHAMMKPSSRDPDIAALAVVCVNLGNSVSADKG